MARVTDVSFPDGLKIDGVSIRTGTDTQVRHDLGCGQITIDGNGKIIYTNFFGNYNQELEKKYTEEMKSFTGVLETNMGYLFFFEGQIQMLDISSSLTACTGTDLFHYLTRDLKLYPAHEKLPNLQGSMNKVEYSVLRTRALDVRKADSSVPIEVTLEYNQRKSEIVDPFYQSRFHHDGVTKRP